MKQKVLLTEDNVDLQWIFTIAFEHLNFSVVVANDGCEALAYLEQSIPDILILDLNMPRCSGQDVLKRLKEWGKIDQVYTIVVTGDALAGRYLDPDMVNLVLIKPVDPVDLAHLAQRIARHSAKQKKKYAESAKDAGGRCEEIAYSASSKT